MEMFAPLRVMFVTTRGESSVIAVNRSLLAIVVFLGVVRLDLVQSEGLC